MLLEKFMETNVKINSLNWKKDKINLLDFKIYKQKLKNEIRFYINIDTFIWECYFWQKIKENENKIRKLNIIMNVSFNTVLWKC